MLLDVGCSMLGVGCFSGLSAGQKIPARQKMLFLQS
jgi:hypothetical protein